MNKGAQNNFGLKKKKKYDFSAEIVGGVDLVAQDVRTQYSRCTHSNASCQSGLYRGLYIHCNVFNIFLSSG